MISALRTAIASFVVGGATVAPAFASAITFAAAGPNTASIQPAVDAFRLALGGNNGVVAQPFTSGRREINWDGLSDALSAPNNMPANQFQARGALFSTPGSGFQVSANAGVAPIEFDNLLPGASDLFAPFSPQRLFVALNSTVTDVTFVVPGSLSPASTSAFGVVFTDVDTANTSSLEFFGLDGSSLGKFFVPNTVGNETFSFLGIRFDGGEQVVRVRITAGDQPVAAIGCNDCVAMDDFLFAEPQSVAAPEPFTAGLVAAGLAGIWMRRPYIRRARLAAARRAPGTRKL